MKTLYTALSFLLLLSTAVAAQERNWEGRYTATGYPSSSSTTPFVDFNWGDNQPDGMPADNWNANFEANVTGEGIHTIQASSDDRLRVYIDGNRVIDDWNPGEYRTRSYQFNLELGTAYAIYVEYKDDTGDSAIKMEWIKPAGTTELIPATESDTADWADVTLTWTAPTLYENGLPLDPDTELLQFRLYRADQGESPELVGTIAPEVRSETRTNVLPPETCWEYWITAVALDGSESALSDSTVECNEGQPLDNTPMPPTFVE